MSHSGSLELLRVQLGTTLDGFGTSLEWEPRPYMKNALKDVRSAFDERQERPDQPDITKAVRSFASTQSAPTFIALKHVCYGVGSVDSGNGQTLVQRPDLLDRLLELVEHKLPTAKQFRRCYQALLDSYFRADSIEMADPSARSLWRRLCEFFVQHLGTLITTLHAGRQPKRWVATLHEHKNLISAAPGKRYIKALNSGEVTELVQACEGLGIARESWIWQETMLDYINSLSSLSDQQFQDRLPTALKTLSAEAEFKLSVRVRTVATASLIRRYAASGQAPEHAQLRDIAIEVIGNPWLNRSAWDGHVNDEGARQLFESWLKRALMRDFFQLLSHDGVANPRRLAYWLKFEPLIERMWFCLGRDTRAMSSPQFKDVRKRMEGLDRALDDPNDKNNAFIMKIGRYFLVEFGVTGNACYVFQEEHFKVDLSKKRVSTNGDLKLKRSAVQRLLHLGNWETSFDAALRKLLGPLTGRSTGLRGVAPKTRTQTNGGALSTKDTLASVADACRAQNVPFVDHRSSGGAFWVQADPDKQPGMTQWLTTMGFAYKPSKGYWLKD